MNQLDYYTQHSKFSNPKRYINLFEEMPNDIESLTKIIRGLIVHQHETEKYYGYKIPEERATEPNTRYIEKILELILKHDNSSLLNERPPEKRFIGLCRDYALMLCSILRTKGVPSRIRCGFANYFNPGEHLDHWLCEYWDKEENKWILVDTEIDDIERRNYSIPEDLNNLDISHDEFWLSSKAWHNLKINPKKESLFGVTSINIVGAWFVRANMFRDIAALNLIELCPWDYTEHSDKKHNSFSEIDNEELIFLDNLANAIDNVYDNFNETISFYKNVPAVQVATKITSYTNIGTKIVNI